MPMLPDVNPLQMVLISPSSQVFCRTACPRAMISEDMFNQDRLLVDIDAQFRRYNGDNFRFIQGRTTQLDHKSRSVTLSKQDGSVETTFLHAVVIATGAATPSPLLGLNRDEKFLHQCWEHFQGELSTAKNIIIAGSGPRDIETAGELYEYLNGRASFFSSRISDPKVTITMITSGSGILPDLLPSIALKAEALLARLGVSVIRNSRVKSVEPKGAGTDPALLTAKTTVHLGDGTSLQADIYIPATGTTPNTSFVTDKSHAGSRRACEYQHVVVPS